MLLFLVSLDFLDIVFHFLVILLFRSRFMEGSLKALVVVYKVSGSAMQHSSNASSVSRNEVIDASIVVFYFFFRIKEDPGLTGNGRPCHSGGPVMGSTGMGDRRKRVRSFLCSP